MKIRPVVVFITAAAFGLLAQAQSDNTTSTTPTPAAASKTGLVHDGTLKGNGTFGAPLGVALPLNLGGALNVTGDSSVSGNGLVGGLLSVGGGISATTNSGNAVEVIGGIGGGVPFVNGSGVKATGAAGQTPDLSGGTGVDAHGGVNGGTGVIAQGGDPINFTNGSRGGTGLMSTGGLNGGFGLLAFGGNNSSGFQGGTGMEVGGGFSAAGGGVGAFVHGGGGIDFGVGGNGDGGTGMVVEGGFGSGFGHKAGTGLVVRPGQNVGEASLALAAQFVGDVDIIGSEFGPGHTAGAGLVVHAGANANVGSGAFAAQFAGNVDIIGNLTKSSGSFKIDHPLDPENKYLSHSFVESPDMMNIYNGTITTDAQGNAIVTLPDWFEALNQDFRYQLTVIGTFAQAIVGDEIKGNRFTVKTNAPNVKVSWQVTGIRHDAYANMHRIAVEERKPEGERGLLLHPDAFHQPESRGIAAANMPRQTERISATYEHTGQGSQQ
jgi:hypothetical protein